MRKTLYERRCLSETMRDTDFVRDSERHWLYETMRDTDWTRLWETLIVRDYERHWLNKTMRDTDCTRLWETLIEQDHERHWLYETMRDTDCTRLWETLIVPPNLGFMKVRYIFHRVCLERENVSLLRTSTCLKDAFTMLSIWFVQFPSDAKVNPTFVWCFTISTVPH
jgi:hypothetical protein